MSRQTPKNAVTARICTLYGDFSARSDSRFTASAPMHPTHPSKPGHPRSAIQAVSITTRNDFCLCRMIVGMGLRGRPAHAEVYLSTSATPGQWKCSPRVRGGLPRNHAYLGTKSGIAPCTRGFTRPPTWCGKRSKGRPVYAGVYRDTRIAAEPREEVAPCTRGFTARPEHSVNKTGGRPVYAGVYRPT